MKTDLKVELNGEMKMLNEAAFAKVFGDLPPPKPCLMQWEVCETKDNGLTWDEWKPMQAPGSLEIEVGDYRLRATRVKPEAEA